MHKTEFIIILDYREQRAHLQATVFVEDAIEV